MTDAADIISAGVEADLNRTLRGLSQSGGSQIAVLTVTTLDGEPIEQASIKVVDAWKLGDANKDNGVLLLIATADRAMRIEVGQGLEGDLPDAYARRIIDDVIGPAFKQGNFDAGIVNGVGAILQKTDPSAAAQQPSRYDPPPTLERGAPIGWPQKILMGIIVCFLLFTRTGRMILFAMILSGGRGRGGRSSGGGFSGGGGGFSGGGASGRW